MLKQPLAALGAVAPFIAIAVLYFVLDPEWGTLGAILAVCAGLVLLSYIVAAVSAVSSLGEFMRGWLIGLNAALNAVLGFAVGTWIGGAPMGIVAAVVLAVINLLCVIAPVTQNGFYQGVLGYLNWLMPMSWLIVALGCTFYVVSIILHLVTAGKVDYLRIQDVGADWKTGTCFIRGGLIANLNYLDTAFNMGNFSFVDYKSSAWHKDHEAGHTLNLAAFGAVFHLVGAFDENVLRRENAYAEQLAESNNPGSSLPQIPMWR
jgi:hypothetical protein